MNKLLKHRRLVLVGIGIILLICIITFSISWNDSSASMLHQDVIYSIQDLRDYTYKAYNNGILIINNEGVVAMDRGGNVRWKVDTSMSDPIVVSSGKHILVASRGGESCTLISNGKIVEEIETKHKIITASLNSRGYFALITLGDAYNNVMTAYTPTGRPYYHWNVSENYMLDVDISSSGKRIVVSQVKFEGTNIEGIISLVDVNAERIIQEHVTQDKLYPKIKFMRDGSIVAVGDENVVKLSSSGKHRFAIDYAGRVLDNYIIDESGIVLSLQNARNASTLEFYSPGGALRRQADISFVPKFVSQARDNVSFSDAHNAVIFSYSGIQKGSYIFAQNNLFVAFVENRGFFGVTGSNVVYGATR